MNNIKIYWAVIKYIIKSPDLIICPIKKVLIELIEYEKVVIEIKAKEGAK